MSVTFAETIPALPSSDVERSVAFYRDAATVHVWGATDESWRERLQWDRPVISGADPNGHLADTPYGTREFAVLDPDGNLVTFYLWQSA